MKLPAIRAKIGNRVYYVTTLTFQQVNDQISRIDNELHRSESLKELIQRNITSNYISIRNYILNQPELFFNSLVLAVYDDYPDWREIEVKYDNEETYQLGLLDFPGKFKIFPVDGQHRVEGIKAALVERPELSNEKIAAIFIGHKNDPEGMRTTRRLFSTLNRYAKPVTMDDIIALDEDDSIAIVTRNLLEEYPLFTGKRVTKSKNKAIPTDDKDSFTSIIALYDCNRELLKHHRRFLKITSPNPERDNKNMEEYLKFRPDDSELETFQAMSTSFWDSLATEISEIKKYVESNSLQPALPFRNTDTGGNLLFRPVGLFPFVQACLEIKRRTNLDFKFILSKFDNIDLVISHKPWRQVLWNSYEKIMIMGNQGLTKFLLIYLFDDTLIRPFELEIIKKRYAAAINFQGENLDEVLTEIK